MSRDLGTVFDIVEAARRAVRFCANIEVSGFLADEEKRWAVVSQIAIIGEAAGRLSEPFRDQQSDIPWREIIGMRNRLIHGYDEINWERVWNTVEKDLPNLIVRLEPLLPESS